MTEHPASRALRARSSDLLLAELIATLRDGRDDWERDTRDLMVALAPFHDCARRLDVDVAALFREAAAAGPPAFRELTTTFGARNDVTPEAFGFTCDEGPEGSRYRRYEPPRQSIEETRRQLREAGIID